MRTVTYGAACSLDGFIAAPDGGVDWLHFSPDVQEVMTRYLSTVDAVLMGRKTWEAAVANGSAGTSDPAGRATYVFSRTLREVPSGVHLVRDDAGGFVRELKARPGKGICVLGGGELACSLLSVDVVDEVGLDIHPVLLGAGVPLVRDAGRRIPLELIEARTIDGGCVLATNRVKRAT